MRIFNGIIVYMTNRVWRIYDRRPLHWELLYSFTGINRKFLKEQLLLSFKTIRDTVWNCVLLSLQIGY